ncbi:ubiquinol--cytochrome-c reductase subunit 10 NDAI_0K01950 [Naumovozyma dairenensis CBS 421]|uniref:Cytochrome b-c1 complex subunit 10 n=1 Tax=Naumovozyma dairenensis (strain ATCC 10597 / BCRC 20456 / CBS 421 / NBRC 0211 / NRRL Y-12639) TaxID=1071378 RepID=G0WHX5_NAUDC|nr:hypothetical protein NDAI_0K01950 [Naumovozyma dairenensis CBS 421]CCD27386.1 hypothetical protein NDAI_0K01950 [Naumovozyma dairenensis CBS 421]
MVTYTSKINTKANPFLGRLSLRSLVAYTPNLWLWGGASLFGMFVFVEGWPTFQTEIFSKIPIFGSHWIKEAPAVEGEVEE